MSSTVGILNAFVVTLAKWSGIFTIAFVAQQLLTSVFYAVMASIVGRWRFFSGYIHEYLLWQVRLPDRQLSEAQIVANVVAALIVIGFLAALHHEGVL